MSVTYVSLAVKGDIFLKWIDTYLHSTCCRDMSEMGKDNNFLQEQTGNPYS